MKMPRNPVNYCYDPYKVHKTKVTRTVQSVSRDFAEAVGKPQIQDSHICLSCRKRLLEPDRKPLEHEASDQGISGEGVEGVIEPSQPASSSSSEKTAEPSSLDTTLEEIVSGADAAVTVSDVMSVLDQTPVRSSKSLLFMGSMRHRCDFFVVCCDFDSILIRCNESVFSFMGGGEA